MKIETTDLELRLVFWTFAEQFGDREQMLPLIDSIIDELTAIHSESDITGLDSQGNVIDRTEYETVHVSPGMTKEEISAALQKKSPPPRRKVPGIPQQLIVIDD